MREHQCDVRKPAVHARIEHVHDRSGRFECDLEHGAGPAHGGRGPGIRVCKDDRMPAIEFSPDRLQARVAEVDPVIAAGNGKAIGMEFGGSAF